MARSSLPGRQRQPHRTYGQVPATYAALGGWIAENGYQIVGPSTEIWLSDADTTPEAELVTELQFPVLKA